MITKIVTDNDGVNIDSEDLAMRIMDDEAVALIGKYNPAILSQLPTDQVYKAFPGTSTDKIVKALIEGDWRMDGDQDARKLPLADIIREHGLPENATAQDAATHIADLITIATIKRFEIELKSIPGTTQAWLQLRETLGAENLALATTSRADRMDVSVENATDPVTGENARLHEFFNKGAHRFSGYGGPNKYDAFFEQSGWNPAECAIIEDSLSGVRYAKAGRPDTKVVGTVAAKFYEDKAGHAAALIENGADIVIWNMADLPAAIAYLNGDTSVEFATAPTFPNAASSGSVLKPSAMG